MFILLTMNGYGLVADSHFLSTAKGALLRYYQYPKE